MKLSELPIGHKAYPQLAHSVLAVLSIRLEGWCIYVDAVPGRNHDAEWPEVAACGTKQSEPVARAIAEHLFRPGYEIDMEYAP